MARAPGGHADHEFLYGPNDGQEWPDDVEFKDDMPVLVGTNLVIEREGQPTMPLLARYLPADHIESGRRVLMFDGWYVNAPGDSYGPRTGGLRL